MNVVYSPDDANSLKVPGPWDELEAAALGPPGDESEQAAIEMRVALNRYLRILGLAEVLRRISG